MTAIPNLTVFLTGLLLLTIISIQPCHSFLSISSHSSSYKFASSSSSSSSSTRRHLNNFFNFDNQNDDKKDTTLKTPQQESSSSSSAAAATDSSSSASASSTFQDGAYDEDDPIEKIFGFFFGKREAEPMGMKRFGRERFPEQYPATKTEWADPVSSDDMEMAKLRPLLKHTNLETRALKLTYSANRHGWTAAAFHKAVDKLGGGLVVCTTTDGLVCGGYNPKGWVGYGEARGSIAAFLFVFDDDGKKNNNASRKGAAAAGVGVGITKLQKVGGPSLAQQDLPELGPCFGADSLVIPLDNSKTARSKLGSYYERFEDGTNSLFGNRGSQVQLKDLKVYHGVYAEDEYIPFTDAEPFALY